MKNVISKYYSIVLLLLTVLMLFAAVAKPIVWPSKIQSEIEQIRKEMILKADRMKVEGDQALIQKDIGYLREKMDSLEEMIKFMYRRSGGKPLKGN